MILFALNLTAVDVIQSMIILVANSLCIKILLGWFFYQSISSYVFYGLKIILLQQLAKIYNLIFLVYVFHSISKSHYYLPLFLHHFLHTFFCLYLPYLYSTEVSVFFISSFISLYSLKTLFTETVWLVIYFN